MFVNNNLLSSQLIRIPATLRENVIIELVDISEIYKVDDSNYPTKLCGAQLNESKYIVRYASDNRLVLLSQPNNYLPYITNAMQIDSLPVRLLIYRDINKNESDADSRLTNSTNLFSIDSIPNIKKLYSRIDNISTIDKIVRNCGEALNLIDGKVLPVIELKDDMSGSVIEPYRSNRLRVINILFLWDSYIVVGLDENTSEIYHIRTNHTFTSPAERMTAFIQGHDEPSIENELKEGNWQKIEIGETYDFLLSKQHISDCGSTIFIGIKNVDFSKLFQRYQIEGNAVGDVYQSANLQGLYISNSTAISTKRSYPNAQFAIIQNKDFGSDVNRLNFEWIDSSEYPLFCMRQYLNMLCWEIFHEIGLKSEYRKIMSIDL